MTGPNPFSRREFVAAAGAATLAGASGFAAAQSAVAGKSRYAMVGTGHRGSGMWGSELRERHGDTVEFVGLCDINPLRARVARDLIGVSCPTFTDFDLISSTSMRGFPAPRG